VCPRRICKAPAARETIVISGDTERQAEEAAREYTQSSPRLTAGDVDADWRRADSVGEEARAARWRRRTRTSVDEIGAARGVPRAPDVPFRPSSEILEGRDRYRAE
jgi:hypothetical protein